MRLRSGCGFTIIYLVIFIGMQVAAERFFGEAGAICARIVSIIIGFTLIPKFLADLRYQQRLEAPSAKEILAKDKRPPIIYLRSFKEEGTRQTASPLFSIYPLINPLGAAVGELPTFEQDLSAYVENIGPFVTFSNRKYGLPELGAARLHAEHDTWREILDDLLKKCQLIIFRAGETQSLLWELGKIVAELPAEKVLIYLQMGTETDAAVQQARYNKFRRLTESIFPKPLPEKRGKNGFLHFTSDWTPILSRNIKTALIEKNFVFESNLIRHGLKFILPFASVNIEIYRYTWPPRQISRQVGIKPEGPASRTAVQPEPVKSRIAEESTLFLHREYSNKNINPNSLTRLVKLMAWGSLISLLLGGLHWFVDSLLNPEALLLLSSIFLAFFAIGAGISIGLLGRYLVVPGSRAYIVAGLLAGSAFMYANFVLWASYYYDAFTFDPVTVFTTMADVADFVARSGDEFVMFRGVWMIEFVEAVILICLMAWIYGLSRSEYRQATAPGTELTEISPAGQ